ncbi:SGNH/GDSL hydrolase family protein [Arsenicicoccus dermatophilus]|uniref:SGNH/GDSL hydrolase family protein n=1 Tax=Arsenicicoccus dermatophilus TaxID=1076331 RepID=UPI003916F3FA
MPRHPSIMAAVACSVVALAAAPTPTAAQAASAGTVAAARPAAVAAAPRVVALGDSFASGEGLFSYDAGTDRAGNQCHRSPLSWQRQLDWGNGLGAINERNTRYSYRQVACAGARTTNIDRNVRPVTDQGRVPTQLGEPAYQMDVLTGSESLVMLTVGANDLGYWPVVTTCVQDSTEACQGITAHYAAAVPAVTGNLEQIVRDIHTRSPRAKIVVAGYPLVIDAPSNPSGRCTGIDSTAATAVRGLMNSVNNAYSARINALRQSGIPVRYANTAWTWLHTDTARHDACAPTTTNWVNGVVGSMWTPDYKSFHPDRAGHAAFTRTADAALRS